MFRGKNHHRSPDPLLLLAAIVVLFAVMTTAATAGESFNFLPKPGALYRSPPQDSGYTVARMGQSGGGLCISLTPPRELPQDFLDGQGSIHKQEMLSHVFLFIHYPW
jgi:hypothetical protein